jgi:hypothetical protein
MPSSSCPSDPKPSGDPKRFGGDGEWTYLTYDVDRPCEVCLNYLHRGQAVGYVNGQLMHAKCYRPEEGSPGRRTAA